MVEHDVNVSACVGVVPEHDCAERAQVRHDAHVLAWLEMPSPAMSAFFLSERGDANPDFDSAFLEATEVSEIEQEIEVRQGFRKTAKSSAERDAAEQSIAALEKRRALLLWPQIGSHQGAEIVAAVPARVLGGVKTWIEKARKSAWEIIKRDKEKDLYPSRDDIADEIARNFRLVEVRGASGKPLSGAYIKRHALKGISSAQARQLSTANSRSK